MKVKGKIIVLAAVLMMALSAQSQPCGGNNGNNQGRGNNGNGHGNKPCDGGHPIPLDDYLPMLAFFGAAIGVIYIKHKNDKVDDVIPNKVWNV